MPSFTMLGEIGLQQQAGQRAERLLRQPKRLALLAYLALPRPGTWHRRDTLLAIFWPEADTSHGRTALRNALYVIRQHLGDDVVLTRGDDEVSLNPETFTTDVAELESSLQAANPAAALALYTGELLPALFVPGAEGFEKWLDGERHRVLTLAQRAASALSEERESAGDLSGAIEATMRAAELDPDSETVLLRLMKLLDQSGAPTKALAAYERFRSRIREEYGMEPSGPTSGLAQQIRSRPRPAEPQPTVNPSPLAPLEPLPASTPATKRLSRRFFAVVLVGVALLAASLTLLRNNQAEAANPDRTLLVLPVENTTGDPDLDYLVTGIADDLAARLRTISGLTNVRSAARTTLDPGVRRDLPLLGREFGAELALRTVLERVHDADSLALTGEVVDVSSGASRSIGTLRFVTTDVPDLESRLLAAVVGTAYRRPVPEDPRPTAHVVDPESYRLTLKGWHEMLVVRDRTAADQLFAEATRLDPGNARAWAGVSSVHASEAVTGAVPFGEGFALSEAAASRALSLDSLQGTALANLAVLYGLRDRDLASAESLIARAIRAEPANPEIYMIEAALYRHAWQWDKARDAIRIARQMDPLNAYYAEREAVLSLCEGNSEAALPIYQAAQRLDSRDPAVRDGMARALARLGRWDDALAEVGAPGHGENAYWEYRTERARPRLLELLQAGRTRWVSRARLGTLYIATGQIDRGLDLLEAEAGAGDVGIYRLPCQPDVDRARDLPRFMALLEVARQTLPR